MDHDRRSCADQILKAIEYGHIPKKEIESRLYEIIDSELSGPLHAEWDRTKVDLCHELLWELYTNGEEPFPENAEAIKERVAGKHSEYKRRRRILTNGLRVAAVVMILVGISVALGLLPSVHWFRLVSTPDQQQVIVVGREVNVQSVANAISSHEESGIFNTTNKEELIQYLGFDPGLPDSLNTEYLPVRYDASIDPGSIRVICQYQSIKPDTLDTRLISVRTTIFSSAESANIHFEQDSTGEKVYINGTIVYKFTNTGRLSYLWTEDHTIVQFVSYVDSDNTDATVGEIIEWRKRK